MVTNEQSSPGGFEVVDQQYVALYRRAQQVLGVDPRVTAVRLSGSIATGTADQWSDLDLKVVTTPEGYESFLADWEVWIAEITPTVFARRPIAPFIVNTLTPEGLTVDLAVYSGVPLDSGPGGYSVGLLASQRFDDLGDALEYAVSEQLRGLSDASSEVALCNGDGIVTATASSTSTGEANPSRGDGVIGLHLGASCRQPDDWPWGTPVPTSARRASASDSANRKT